MCHAAKPLTACTSGTPGSLRCPRGIHPAPTALLRAALHRTGHAGRRNFAPRPRSALALSHMTNIHYCDTVADTCADNSECMCLRCFAFGGIRACAGIGFAPAAAVFERMGPRPFALRLQMRKNPAPRPANRPRPTPGGRLSPRPWPWAKICCPIRLCRMRLALLAAGHSGCGYRGGHRRRHSWQTTQPRHSEHA